MNEMTDIRDWYLETFPEDELGQDLVPGVTFMDLFEALDAYQDIYELLFGDPLAGDSLIRERVFAALAEIMDVPYGEIYDQWMMESSRNEAYMEADGYTDRIEDHRNTALENVEMLLEQLYDKSALTFEGLTEDSIPDALEYFIEEKGQEEAFANVFSGRQFNEIFRLSGGNAYPDDFVMVVFENTGTVLAITIGARWLDDIVNNNAEREGYHAFDPNFFEEGAY